MKEIAMKIAAAVLLSFWTYIALAQPCSRPANCPKKYPYQFCTSNAEAVKVICTEDHHSPSHKAAVYFPLTTRLPICFVYENTANDPTIEKWDGKNINNITIFSITEFLSDMTEICNEWNCLCNKQNTSEPCCVKIQFSENPQDFPPDPKRSKYVAVFWYASSVASNICTTYCNDERNKFIINGITKILMEQS